MPPTSRLFRKLLLLSLILSLAQWAITLLLPDLVPEPLRIADGKAREEMGKSLATLVNSPSLAILLTFWSLAGVVALLSATVVSFIGLFMFKSWARRLTIITMLFACLGTFFSQYSLMSGLEAAFAYAQAVLWGLILSMAYFSPVSQHFVLNER